MTLPFYYQSGEEIKPGDKVTFHGEPGTIESVAHPLVKNAETDWHVKEHGGGVMILEPKVFGRAFLTEPADAEDLVFISRAKAG